MLLWHAGDNLLGPADAHHTELLHISQPCHCTSTLPLCYGAAVPSVELIQL
jgi:hypothetical protein